MSSAKSSQSSLHKDNCSSALLSSLNVLLRLSVKGELIGWTQFNYVTVYLWLIKTIPFCAHAFSFFMSVWKQIYSSWYYLLSQNWTSIKLCSVLLNRHWSTSVYMWSPDPGKSSWSDARLSRRTTTTAVPSSGQDENSYWYPGHLASSHLPSQCQKPGWIHKHIFTFFK